MSISEVEQGPEAQDSPCTDHGTLLPPNRKQYIFSLQHDLGIFVVPVWRMFECCWAENGAVIYAANDKSQQRTFAVLNWEKHSVKYTWTQNTRDTDRGEGGTEGWEEERDERQWEEEGKGKEEETVPHSAFFRKLSFLKKTINIMKTEYSWHYECVEERHGSFTWKLTYYIYMSIWSRFSKFLEADGHEKKKNSWLQSPALIESACGPF